MQSPLKIPHLLPHGERYKPRYKRYKGLIVCRTEKCGKTLKEIHRACSFVFERHLKFERGYQLDNPSSNIFLMIIIQFIYFTILLLEIFFSSFEQSNNFLYQINFSKMLLYLSWGHGSLEHIHFVECSVPQQLDYSNLYGNKCLCNLKSKLQIEEMFWV